MKYTQGHSFHGPTHPPVDAKTGVAAAASTLPAAAAAATAAAADAATGTPDQV